MDQLSISEATRLITAYLEGIGNFTMSDADLFPTQGKQPPRDVNAIFGNFTGIALANAPREGKQFEYTGTILFSIQQDGKSFYKCPLQVSIPAHINEGLIADIEFYESIHKHHDVAISKGAITVKTGKTGNPYLSLSSDSYELVQAWQLQIRDYKDRSGEAVRRMEGDRFIRESGGGKKVVTIFGGDTEVYDQDWKIPQNGSIRFNGLEYGTLDDLVPALITSPKFMRIYNEMDEQTYRHRVELLEDFLLTIVADWRDDYDGLQPEQIDDAALKVLKILQPKMSVPQPVKHVAPPIAGFSFKVPKSTT